MSLSAGTRLGPYEVLGSLGAGGMGEVYRARDTQLDRDVAIKVLPDVFVADADRVARFEREAKTLASLNHPNIATIHGLQEGDPSTGSGPAAIRALVMELVEGPTLADRIAQGPIALDEALAIAKQIAEALEAAHEHGIVHRDLKPANIKLRPDGTVKVLDFGLAKTITRAGGASPSASMSPTLDDPAMTGVGVILGTAAYMSPEQAKGRPIDKRADIWAFGCVLYEMLTARRAFEGDDVTEILARVLEREPDATLLPPTVPPRIRELLRLCLQKNPNNRRQAAGDVRIDLVQALTEPVSAVPTSTPARDARAAWFVATAAVLLAVVFAIPTTIHLREAPAPAAPEMRLEISTPPTSSPFSFALSPDGRYMAFVASGNGPKRLWLRPLDKTDAQPLAGTDEAEYPFWSADSRSIGFFASSKLYRVEIAGGPPQVLADAAFGRGGTWNADGTILFALSSFSPLVRVTARGGDPVAVTRLDAPRQTSHRFPHFLPDGRRFLFYVMGAPEASGIYLGSLDGGEPKRLTSADTAAQYLVPDHLVWMRQGTLVAQRFDAARGELTGDPMTLADGVGYDAGGAFLGAFSVSADGRIAYRASAATRRQLKWIDRTGQPASAASEPDEYGLVDPELSPDGRRIAVQRTVQNNSDVWLMDLVRGGFTRFTFDTQIDGYAVWSPDGSRIVFSSTRKGTFDLYLKRSTGAGAEELLLATPNIKTPHDWSKDGRYVLYYEIDPKTGRDLWALDMTAADPRRQLVVGTPFDERHGRFSPDGRWVAYATNESGRFEVVVQAFPEPSGGKWQVSTGGGVQPLWRPDGKELYFIAPDARLMALSVAVDLGKKSDFEAGAPVPLFPTRIVADGMASFRVQYAVSLDGRFLINQLVEEHTVSPITLLLNWTSRP